MFRPIGSISRAWESGLQDGRCRAPANPPRDAGLRKFYEAGRELGLSKPAKFAQLELLGLESVRHTNRRMG